MTDGEVKDFDMGDAFDALIEKQDGPPPEAVSEPEMPEVEDDQERDEKGRFAAREKDETTEPEADAEVPAEPTPEPEAEPQEVAEPDAALRLPKEIRDEWKTLSEPVRTALEKREREVHEVVTRVDRERQVGRTFDQSIEEYKPIIEAAGGTPIVAVRNLLETARVLYNGTPDEKSRMLNMIATQYDIDIESAYFNRPDPTSAKLQLTVQQQSAALAQYQQQEQAAASQNVEQSIQDWSQGKEHFDEVLPEMVRLASAGVSTDLQRLYEIAIASSDTLRSTSIDKAVQVKLDEEKAKQAELVAKAKRGAVSPPSASGNAKPPGSANLSDLEALSRDYDEIAARNTG